LIFEHLFDQYRLGPHFPRITFQPSTSAICFSLAGSIFYLVLKRLFPIPFAARFFDLSFQDPISEFMGPNYRQAVRDGESVLCPPFLHRSVYGDEPGLQEWRLYERFQDHFNSYICDLPSRARLPSPHNKGEEWYTEVQKKIAELEVSGWPEGAQRFWKSTSVYGRIKADEILTAWSEWIVMVGL